MDIAKIVVSVECSLMIFFELHYLQSPYKQRETTQVHFDFFLLQEVVIHAPPTQPDTVQGNDDGVDELLTSINR